MASYIILFQSRFIKKVLNEFRLKASNQYQKTKKKTNSQKAQKSFRSRMLDHTLKIDRVNTNVNSLDYLQASMPNAGLIT